jgi:hypothetical protein
VRNRRISDWKSQKREFAFQYSRFSGLDSQRKDQREVYRGRLLKDSGAQKRVSGLGRGGMGSEDG